jgi:hypothetical protein
MRSSLFWDIIQHRLVVTSVSGQPFSHIFKVQAVQGDCLTPEDQTTGLSWNVCVTNQTTNPCCIASQNGDDLTLNTTLGALVSLVNACQCGIAIFKFMFTALCHRYYSCHSLFWQCLCVRYVARILKLVNTNIQVYKNILLSVTFNNVCNSLTV